GDIITSFEIDAGGRVITVVTGGADEVPARGHGLVDGVAPGGYPVISGAGAVLAGRVGAGRCQGERRGTESACRREVEVVGARFVVHLLDDRQVSQRLVVVGALEVVVGVLDVERDRPRQLVLGVVHLPCARGAVEVAELPAGR